MKKISTERVVFCPICGNRLFSTSLNADIFIKCGRCNNQLQATIFDGSVGIDVIYKDRNTRPA